MAKPPTNLEGKAPGQEPKRQVRKVLGALLIKPPTVLWGVLAKISELSVPQIRSLATVGFLAGIIALSGENWGITFYVDHTAHKIDRGLEGGQAMLSFLTERMRYTSGLQAWFAIIIGAVILGAEYVTLKLGQYEASVGKVPQVSQGSRTAPPAERSAQVIEEDLDNVRLD